MLYLQPTPRFVLIQKLKRPNLNKRGPPFLQNRLSKNEKEEPKIRKNNEAEADDKDKEKINIVRYLIGEKANILIFCKTIYIFKNFDQQ